MNGSRYEGEGVNTYALANFYCVDDNFADYNAFSPHFYLVQIHINPN